MIKVSRILTAKTFTVYRSEPINDPARAEQLAKSVGGQYPISRNTGDPEKIGTYVSLDKDITLQYIKGNLAKKDNQLGGAMAVIQVDPASMQKGDGGLDEAVIITNLAVLVSSTAPSPKDPLRIQQRKEVFLKTFGPGVKKFLSDPLLSDPETVKQWYNTNYNKSTWDALNSGKSVVSKPGESDTLGKAEKALTPLAEKIRRDPEVIEFFMTHKPEDWVERNFRINSDGSGTKVLKVTFFDREGNITPSLVKEIKTSRILRGNQSEFPKAGAQVDGLQVGSSVPNTASISASLGDYEVLPGIREVPMEGWTGDPRQAFYAADDQKRCKALADTIKESGWIAPLIVVIEANGEPYILEGGHRLSALWLLGKKSFPAMVVLDQD